MKLSDSIIRRHRGSHGFTLIEVLVVVAIIVVLAGLTAGGIKMANVRAKTQETQVRIKAVEDWLTRYNQDNGEYPIPANKTMMGTYLNVDWNVGSAACLYQAVTGDGNDQIAGYRPKQGETAAPSEGELGSSGGEIYCREMSGSTKSWFKKSDSVYAILCGFGLPFQYVPVDRKNPDASIHNENFDLWSYGNQIAPDDSTDGQRAWIKNW